MQSLLLLLLLIFKYQKLTFSQLTSAASDFKSFLLRQMEIFTYFLARCLFPFATSWWVREEIELCRVPPKTKDTRNMREILHMTKQSCRMLAKRLLLLRLLLLLHPLPGHLSCVCCHPAKKVHRMEQCTERMTRQRVWVRNVAIVASAKKASNTEREGEREMESKFPMAVGARANESVGSQSICKMLQENFPLSKA